MPTDQKDYPDNREEEISPKHHPGIARRKIVIRDHVINVTASRAPKEERRPDHGRNPTSPLRSQSKKPDGRKAETGKTDFGLKRTGAPADEVRSHLRKEDVYNEIVEIVKADREKAVIEKE
jgi:hypothetical protein